MPGDISEPSRSSPYEAVRRLQAVTDTALGHLSLDALLDELLTRVRRILAADTAAILLLDGDVLVTRAAKGLEEAAQRSVRIPLGEGFAGRVAVEKQPIALEDVHDAEVHSPLLREKGIRSLLGVPILFESKVIGVLHVGTLERHRFQEPDAQLLQVVADRIGLGIAYARLYEEERRARAETETERARAAFLANVTGLLAASLDYEATLRNLVRLAVPDRGECCVIDIADEPGGATRRVAVTHVEPAKEAILWEIERRYPMRPEDPSSAAQVARTGKPVLLAEVTEADRVAAAHNPEHLELMHQLAFASSISVPLVARGRTLGTLSFATSDSGRRYGPVDLAVAQDLANRAALAVDNARLYREAQDAEQRALFLAEASRLLAASLDYPTTLQNIARLVVSRLGDWCVIDVLEEGRIRRVAVMHQDPSKAAMAEELERRPPPDLSARSRLTRVLSTGKSGFYPEVRVQEEEVIADDLRRRFFRTVNPASVMIVPLTARGRTFGAITVIMSGESSRRYTAADLALAEELARRAAIAVDNARLYREAQKSRVEAVAASRAKDEFLATVSHELRTPLTPILTWARLLDTGRLDPARTAEAVGAIQRGAKAQVQLIEDLLDVSRIITGKLRLNVQRVELSPVIEAAVESMRPAMDAKGIRLQVVLDPRAGVVSGDPERLQQVVWNLLSNAIKFTPKSGRVQVTLERVNSHVELTVRDTGRGIAPEFLPHAFERFGQADGSTTRHHGGLGLGLAIVRHLVELHGGTVRAESAGEGKGALFTVGLPLLGVAGDYEAEDRRHPTAGELSRLRPRPLAGLEGVRVLVVDDERETCKALEAVLAEAGAEVRTCLAAEEAVAEVPAWRPHVVVSDIGMPGTDGYAFIRKVRTLAPEEGGRVPAVALTAYARAEDRVFALSAGFQMHVAKPVEPAELVAVVATLTGRDANPQGERCGARD